MKVDSDKIDKLALRQLLEEQYGLYAAELSFVPGGEESYGYMVESASQMRTFVRVCPHSSELAVRYQAAHHLHTQCSLHFVVHPHATRQGEFHANWGEHTVAVFDFVDGTLSDPSGFSDAEWEQVAIATASLHKSVQCATLPSLPAEQFEIWFEEWLFRVLKAVEDGKPLESECERAASKLLAQEKRNILMALDKVKQLAEYARTATLDHALTHGDLKAENFIKGSGGTLHLIDWSKIALAPPERDLINFAGERFELFLSAYVNSYDQAPALHPELFEFYGYFLHLWTIADYGSWIVLEDADPVEKEHAWIELQRYLPLRHEQLQADSIRQVIRRVTGAG